MAATSAIPEWAVREPAAVRGPENTGEKCASGRGRERCLSWGDSYWSTPVGAGLSHAGKDGVLVRGGTRRCDTTVDTAKSRPIGAYTIPTIEEVVSITLCNVEISDAIISTSSIKSCTGLTKQMQTCRSQKQLKGSHVG